MRPDDTDTVGFDTLPNRHPAMTVLLVAVVVFASAGAAVGFKHSALWIVEAYGDSHDVTRAADLHPWLVFGIVTAATLIAAILGRVGGARWPRQSGLEAIAASARGEDRRISLRATIVRASAVWLCVVGLVPIGREGALMETGGAIGSTLGRRFGGRGAAMATSGISAAFAAAYHAPIAAVLFLDEHLRIRSSRRASVFAIAGAIGGHLLNTKLFDGKALLPRVDGSWSELAVAGTVALVPATLGARALLELRTGAAVRAGAEPSRTLRWWTFAALGSLAAGAVVARYPLTAGNGMDSLRHTATLAVLGAGVAVALSIGKSVGVTSAFRAGAPGGAMTPTMTVAAGCALLVVLALDPLGADDLYLWGVVFLAASVGVGVGLRAPLTAIAMLPEMCGRIALIPFTAAMVGAAVLLDRGVDRVVGQYETRLPTGVRDEDG